MAGNLRTYDQLVPYLTKRALDAVKELVDAGVDRDLAMTLIEMKLPEEEVYELGSSDEN
jgi:hypothetical protein